jgi:hypothetical protein
MVIRDLSQRGPNNRGGQYVTAHSYEVTTSGGHGSVLLDHQGLSLKSS